MYLLCTGHNCGDNVKQDQQESGLLIHSNYSKLIKILLISAESWKGGILFIIPGVNIGMQSFYQVWTTRSVIDRPGSRLITALNPVLCLVCVCFQIR